MTKNNQTTTEEKIRKIYNDTITMARMRTGSPIDYLTDEIMQLRAKEKKTFLDSIFTEENYDKVERVYMFTKEEAQALKEIKNE